MTLGAHRLTLGADYKKSDTQTINYEIVTRISSRVERLYVGGSWVEAELNELWGTGQEQES